mmetsp:Transcript_14099/g.10152  ORF Transcript_14099/g.10152 Transcript_14099/m.10152 type:complete len:92 (+) Transcript_14099:87-362(+)
MPMMFMTMMFMLVMIMSMIMAVFFMRMFMLVFSTMAVTHVWNCMEEHIPKKPSNSKCNQIVDDSLFDRGRTQKENVQAIYEKDGNDGDKQS